MLVPAGARGLWARARAAARRGRARRPGWSRRCSAIAALICLAELLGTFAAFESWTMIAGGAGAGRGRALGVAPLRGRGAAPRRRRRRRRGSRSGWRPAPARWSPRPGWCRRSASLAGGMDRADTLWYHMPLAARFADGAHFGSIDHFDPIFFASLLPGELRGRPRGRRCSPSAATSSRRCINLGWLALGLTAAYAIGRPYGVGPQSLIGGAIALGAQNLVEFQAGEALNDIVGVALILCAVAVLVNAWARGQRAMRARSRDVGMRELVARRCARGRGPGRRPRGRARSSRSSPPSLPCSWAWS